jgi:catechol 2,3-dioxygenase-like lactoylglutathione lyase family enzyme
MIDHLAIPVSDVAATKRQFEAALAPLGVRALFEVHGVWAFGEEYPYLWLAPGKPGEKVHLAFASKDRATVNSFHTAALVAGMTDNGGPGLRPHYHEHYYAAYALDRDGNNIEAVCHTPHE